MCMTDEGADKMINDLINMMSTGLQDLTGNVCSCCH